MGCRSDLIDRGTHPVVGAADHRAAQFDGTEFCIGEMLGRRRAFFEPAVVGHIEDHLRTRADELPCQTRHGVLKTNRWDHPDGSAGCRNRKRLQRLAGSERSTITCSGLLFVDFFQQRNRLHKGNVFAEDHEVAFSVGEQFVVLRHHRQRIPCAPARCHHELIAFLVRLKFVDAVNQVERAGRADF